MTSKKYLEERALRMIDRKRIAIVDDDLFYCKILKEKLNANGFTNIDVYVDNEEFIKSGIPYNYVFMDHNLGKINGLQVLGKYGKLREVEKIIYMSGYPMYSALFGEMEPNYSNVIFTMKKDITPDLFFAHL